jgi:hypothetical protein
LSTAFAARLSSVGASEEADVLRRHLDSCLSELWADLPAPVWVADARGDIIYVNRTAETSCNGAGLGQATACIAAALRGKAGSRPAAASDEGRPTIEVSPLIDGCGQRVGWLAIGEPAR